MHPELHDKLIQDLGTLRDFVSEKGTESIVGSCYATILQIAKKEKRELLSPSKQILFLLGIMLTTEEPEDPKPIKKEDWDEVIELLNSISISYAWMYWPSKEEFPLLFLDENWGKVREVAMPFFLHYFNNSILASVEQVEKRIKKYITPFDESIEKKFHISASSTIEINSWVFNKLENLVQEARIAGEKERKARIKLLDEATDHDWDMDRIREEAQKERYLPFMINYMDSIKSLLKIPLNEIKTNFSPKIAEAYWNLFVSKRGEFDKLTYFTEKNLAEEKPLFEIENEIAMTPLPNAIYWATLDVFERYLSQSSEKHSFFEKRDKSLEIESKEVFQKIFGEQAVYFENLFETEDNQFEHDLIIKWKKILLIVESKASPPKEPFRDPDKAFIRIERDFKSDTGIQKGFDQANRIYIRLVNKNEEVRLFDKSKNHITTLNPDDFNEVYSIVVTRDNFGSLATNLSLLLKKDKSNKYPWVVNILDLQNISNAWNHFNYEADKLIDYISNRIKIHGKVITNDELDIVGFYLRHDGLSEIIQNESIVGLNPSYSDIFDEVYKAEQSDQKFEFSPTQPVIEDMSDLMNEFFEKPTNINSNKFEQQKDIKLGRNDPCYCGSGKKYKHCCLNKM